jgi:HEAT repeat protein
VRANCAEALLAPGTDGRAALEAALASDDRFARARAREAMELERVRSCRALGRAADPPMAPLVAAALQDEAWSVRAQAARALGAMRADDRATVGRLAAGLSDPAWWVRANCAEALLAAGPDGRAALEAALASDDRFARERAREALELERVREEVRAA